MKTTVIYNREYDLILVVSPASSKLMLSSSLKKKIWIENIKKLKLISPLDDGKLFLKAKI